MEKIKGVKISSRKIEIAKFFVFALFLILVLGLFILHFYFDYSIQDLIDFPKQFGNCSLLIIFIMLVISSFLGVIFQVPVAIASLSLNYYLAFLLSWAGLLIGSVMLFFFSRYFGREYFEDKFSKSEKFKHYDYWFKTHGFWAILIFRLIGFIPFELINIFAGLSRIRFRDFFWGTFFGFIPGILITVYFMSTLKTLWSWQFFVASGLLTVFSLAPLLFKKIRMMVFGRRC